MSSSYLGAPTTPTAKRIASYQGTTPIGSPNSYGPITPRRRQKTSLFMPSRKQASVPYPSPSSRPTSQAFKEAQGSRRGGHIPTTDGTRTLHPHSVNGDATGESASPSGTHSLQPLRSPYAESEIISPTTNLPLDRTFNPAVERASTRVLGYAEMQLLQASPLRTPKATRRSLARTMKGLPKLEAGILQAGRTTRKNKAL